MAIRGIATREKRKEEEKKSKSSERTSDSAPSINFTDKPVPQDENAHQNSV